jgi:hypothetical protein
MPASGRKRLWKHVVDGVNGVPARSKAKVNMVEHHGKYAKASQHVDAGEARLHGNFGFEVRHVSQGRLARATEGAKAKIDLPAEANCRLTITAAGGGTAESSYAWTHKVTIVDFQNLAIPREQNALSTQETIIDR